MKWLLDTNIISFLLRGNVEVRRRHTTAREAADTRFVLSPVVDYEIRRYLLLKQRSSNHRLESRQNSECRWATSCVAKTSSSSGRWIRYRHDPKAGYLLRQ